jgi:hypothetical protein
MLARQIKKLTKADQRIYHNLNKSMNKDSRQNKFVNIRMWLRLIVNPCSSNHIAVGASHFTVWVVCLPVGPAHGVVLIGVAWVWALGQHMNWKKGTLWVLPISLQMQRSHNALMVFNNYLLRAYRSTFCTPKILISLRPAGAGIVSESSLL